MWVVKAGSRALCGSPECGRQQAFLARSKKHLAAVEHLLQSSGDIDIFGSSAPTIISVGGGAMCDVSLSSVMRDVRNNSSS